MHKEEIDCVDTLCLKIDFSILIFHYALTTTKPIIKEQLVSKKYNLSQLICFKLDSKKWRHWKTTKLENKGIKMLPKEGYMFLVKA